jgi:hypothetical protein
MHISDFGFSVASASESSYADAGSHFLSTASAFSRWLVGLNFNLFLSLVFQ